MQSMFAYFNPLSFVYKNKERENFIRALSAVSYDLLNVRAVSFSYHSAEIRNFLSTER